ncbi:RIP metalloprotease RseP [Alphaproteobacteria bacterium]|nr:RIP metalloprotease RseP [Alphaproteobacteria bacterium]
MEKKIAAMTAEEKAVSMYHKTVYQRIEIAAAGPIANYILAFFILSFIYVFHGQPAEAPAAQIGGIVASSPADKAGLLPGDTVLAVGGTAVKTFQELAEAVQKSTDTALDLRVLRGEKNITTHVTFEADSEDKKARRIMGVVPLLIFEKMPVWEAGGAAILRCYDVTVMTLKALGQMIIGERGAQELSGPLGIARATKMSASRSIWDFLWLGAMISLALAIFNFLPIPALDGGHLLFYFIEAVRGKALSIKTQERFMFVGFAILIGVFLFATANDINAMFFR